MSYATTREFLEQMHREDMEERRRAAEEVALWAAATAVREGLKRGDPEAIELMNELKEQK
jgi:hypothetical protein